MTEALDRNPAGTSHASFVLSSCMGAHEVLPPMRPQSMLVMRYRVSTRLSRVLGRTAVLSQAMPHSWECCFGPGGWDAASAPHHRWRSSTLSAFSAGAYERRHKSDGDALHPSTCGVLQVISILCPTFVRTVNIIGDGLRSNSAWVVRLSWLGSTDSLATCVRSVILLTSRLVVRLPSVPCIVGGVGRDQDMGQLMSSVRSLLCPTP